MNISFAKYTLLFIMILFAKHSIAQETNTAPDSSNTVRHPSEQIKKNSIVKSITAYDTIKHTITPVNKKEKVFSVPSTDVAKVKTVYILEVAKPIATQSDITFNAGQVFSTFKFIDSKGVKSQNYTHNATGAYSLGYQYVSNNGFFYHAAIGLRDAGASLVNDGISCNWVFQYADAYIGAGYMLNTWRIKPYLAISPYYSELLKANETIGTLNYDIRQNQSIQTSDWGFLFSSGIKLALSYRITFSAGYSYILGLRNLETGIGQQAYNRGFSLNAELAFKIILYHQKAL